MNCYKTHLFVPLAVILIGLALPATAQDTVTIPKSRLQELERAEEELRKLKGTNAATNVQSAQPQEQSAADKAPQPVVVPQENFKPQPSNFSDKAPQPAAVPQEEELRKLKNELSKSKEQNPLLQK